MTRRMLLRGLGGATLALPFLPSLQGESAAAPGTQPKRFIYVSIACGEYPDNWWPTHPFTFTEHAGSVRTAALTEVTGQGGLSRVIGPALDPFLSKMIFLRGLDQIGEMPAGVMAGHRAHSTLNANRYGYEQTIDQRLAQSSVVYPTPPALRSLHLMSLANQGEYPASIAADNSYIYSDAAPSVTWQRLFGNFVGDDPQAQLRRDLEMGVIDRVRDQFDRLDQHPRLSREDRQRLTSHLELIHDLQLRIAASSSACEPPAVPTDPATDSEAGLDEWTELNIQLLASALACDQTRVAVLQLCVGTDFRFEHHGVSHSALYEPVNMNAFATIHRHYADQLATLLGALDSIIEDPIAGTTVLDNSVVLFGNEDGCNWNVHEGCAMPMLLAGSCGGYFDTGRYVDYRQYEMVDGMPVGQPFLHPAYGPLGPGFSDFRGRAYNSLLLSILEAMGETPPEEGIGDYANNQGMFDEQEMRRPLPYLSG